MNTTISKQAQEFAEENDLSEEINQAYIDNIGVEYATAADVEEAYSGDFISNEEFAQDLLEQTGDLPNDLPIFIHIDWERTASDIMMDYFEADGHYFRNL